MMVALLGSPSRDVQVSYECRLESHNHPTRRVGTEVWELVLSSPWLEAMDSVPCGDLPPPEPRTASVEAPDFAALYQSVLVKLPGGACATAGSGAADPTMREALPAPALWAAAQWAVPVSFLFTSGRSRFATNALLGGACIVPGCDGPHAASAGGTARTARRKSDQHYPVARPRGRRAGHHPRRLPHQALRQQYPPGVGRRRDIHRGVDRTHVGECVLPRRSPSRRVRQE